MSAVESRARAREGSRLGVSVSLIVSLSNHPKWGLVMSKLMTGRVGSRKASLALTLRDPSPTCFYQAAANWFIVLSLPPAFRAASPAKYSL